jgi:hypothetical protein
MARKKGAYKQYLAQRRRTERLAASREAEVLAAKLEAHLSPGQWAEVKANWEARPDLYLPSHHLNFLICEAGRLGRLDLIPLSAVGV